MENMKAAGKPTAGGKQMASKVTPIDKVQEALTSVRTLLLRIESIVGALVGSCPQDANDEQPITPDGMLNEIESVADRIVGAANAADRELDRLVRSIPNEM